MKLLPYENFCITTPMRAFDVWERIAKEIEPDMAPGDRGSYINQYPRPYFCGYIINDQFEFRRIINYRNSFIPQIKGSIEPRPDGSRIHIKMRMDKATSLFVPFWFAGIGYAAISTLLTNISENTFSSSIAILFGVLFFGYLMVIRAFQHERNKALYKLLDILNGQIIEE